jgi:lipid-A-disaccharide synthase
MMIYFVAGEASADNHGAALMRALRQLDVDLGFLGRGGPQMKAVAGERFRNWIDESGVLGLWEVIKHYGYFRKQFHQTLNEIETSKPDAVLLIDYPGFNLRLARALRKQSPTQKIIYYISPQVWAWNRGRIKKMARWLDLMLCIFPFEADLYNRSGLRTIFVGHPMIERLREHQPSVAAATYGSAGQIDIQRDPNLIGLFPGSRAREVRKIFPVLIETAREIRQSKPNARFEVAAASSDLAREMQKMWHRHLADEAHGLEGRATIETGQTAKIMQCASVGIVASGSATLEAAYFRLPFALIYKVSWLTYLAGRLLVKVKYLGMPNVLANKEIVPEFIQHRAEPREISKAVLLLLDQPAQRQAMISEFDKIIGQLGEAGASERAARAVLEEIA